MQVNNKSAVFGWLIVDRYLMKWKQQTLSAYQWMAGKIRSPKSTLPGEVCTCSNPVGVNTFSSLFSI